MDNWTIVIIMLILSGFFSGIEIAFVSSNRLKLELDKSKGHYNAQIIASFATQPSKFIGALLLGNNIALVLYGIAMAKILTPWLQSVFVSPFNTEFFILLSQTIIATLLILFTAEFLPKVLFRIRPNAIVNFFAVPIKMIYYILYPFVFLFIGFSEFVLKKLFRLNFDKEDYTKTENYLLEIEQLFQTEEAIIDMRFNLEIAWVDWFEQTGDFNGWMEN